MALRSSFYREGSRGPATSFIQPYVPMPPAPIDVRSPLLPSPPPWCHDQPMRHDYGGDFRCAHCARRVHQSQLTPSSAPSSGT